MNFKSQKGFTGVDIAVAIVLIFIFISIIAVLFYNLNSSSQEIERKSQATYYAIAEIENIKNEGFEAYELYNKTNYPPTNKTDSMYKDGYILDENGVETAYYKEVKVEDYAEMQGNEGKLANLVKKITVTVSYKFKTETKEVSLSTVLSKGS